MESAPITGEQRPYRILLVEDEEILSGILSEKLAKMGYEVIVAVDGEAGFEHIMSSMPDVVLLDMLLPKLSGFSILERLHELGRLPSLPVIVISNSGQPIEIERVEKLGIRDYLVKLNFDPDEVIEKVRAVLATEEAKRTPHETVLQTPETTVAPSTLSKDDLLSDPASPPPFAPPIQVAPSATPLTPAEGAKAHVLVVEDDMFIADLLGRKLHERYEVHHALDTKMAEKLLKENPIKLICLDIMLPGEDGYSFLGKLKSSEGSKNIPVLILSNLGQQEEIQRGLDAGAADYLIKANMSPDEILKRVSELMQ